MSREYHLYDRLAYLVDRKYERISSVVNDFVLVGMYANDYDYEDTKPDYECPPEYYDFEDDSRCVCGEPIKNVCEVRDKLTNVRAFIGKCCIKRFGSKEMVTLAKGLEGLSKNKVKVPRVVVERAKADSVISDKHAAFLLSIGNKKKLSQKQQHWRTMLVERIQTSYSVRANHLNRPNEGTESEFVMNRVKLEKVVVDWANLPPGEPDIKYKPVWKLDLVLTEEESRVVFAKVKDAVTNCIKDKMENTEKASDKECLSALLESDKALARAIFSRANDGTIRLRAKRSAATGSTPPQIVDANKQSITKGIIAKGDTVNIHMQPFAWVMGGKTAGVTFELEGVQLVTKAPRAVASKPIGAIDWDGNAAPASSGKDLGF